MHFPSKRWPDSEEGQGTLFVAQLLEELLNDRAWDSYRVYALDNISRLRELITLIDDVRSEKIHHDALRPVIDELHWSLPGDPIACEVLQIDIKVFLGNELTMSTPHSGLVRSARYLLDKLTSKYKPTCERAILQLYSDSGKRQRLRTVVKLYCSHLLSTGNSRAYIYRHVQHVFFSSDHRKISAALLLKFFKLFNRKKTSFSVYCQLPEKLAEIAAGMFKTELLVSSEIPLKYRQQERSFFRNRVGTKFLKFKNVPASDEGAAYLLVEYLMSSCGALLFLHPNDLRIRPIRAVYVVAKRATLGRLYRPGPPPLERRAKLTFEEVQANVVQTARAVFGGAVTDVDRFRFVQALKTGGLAQQSTSSENQLISLWSAFEALLPEPDKGTARIVHYERLMVPCIVDRYIEKTFAAVFSDLHVAYLDGFTDIVGREIHGDTLLRKFVSLCLLRKGQPLQDELLRLCERNPLALNRLGYLSHQFRTIALVRQYIKAHFNRVSWQIHRIYRERNGLVHAGRNSGFIETLVMNLDDYYREVIHFILLGLQRRKYNGIDQIVYSAGVDHRLYMESLKESKQRTELEEGNIFQVLNL